jgi:hypothetical protein
MPLTAEHKFQIDVVKLSREVIACPFRFRSFDRSRNHSGTQHLNEATRGIRKGTPDTETIALVEPGACGISVNIELKDPTKKGLKAGDPSDDQVQEMQFLRAAGAYADVAYSCAEVVAHWRRAGVPLTPMADVVALDRDLKRDGRAAKSKAVAPKSYKPRRPKPGQSAINRHNARAF